MQEREEKVDSGEVKFDEVVDQVRLWKVVTGQVEEQGSTLPLQIVGRVSRAKGATM
jgi:hypothetical protein